MLKTAKKSLSHRSSGKHASLKKDAVFAKKEIAYSQHEFIEVTDQDSVRIFNKVTGKNGKRVILG